MTQPVRIPLRVRADLPHGVCFGQPWGISLDGLLASVIWHRRKAAAAARGDVLTYDPLATPEDLDLPLARCTLGQPWHWMCTFANTTPATSHPDTRTRSSRTDHADLQRLSALVPSTVSDARGHYRKRLIPAVATVTATVTWRAVGDPDAIRELLAEVSEIGKYRTSGEGRVNAWTVDDAPADDWWSAGHEHTPGVLGRIAPTACLADHPDLTHGGRSRAAVRAPYTHPSRHAPDAYLPGVAAAGLGRRF
ncbi:hypothetical protein [Gordonia sp. OPL2]|uniref:hypothetical protein n=1 Tax=Gordonia sp. OPL2 TaxID=2486274 RepID=UPI0021CC6BFD|nr:hypothetical protein [Gordonia sp. OPL2]